ncbi:MAG TPA: TerC/Alx family metal homeostasis membrane protein [bacterium]|nr:TerC/Alx family metal homeostasis membrane protein [bacterium]
MAPGVAFWVGFQTVILGLLALDLGVFDRRPHRVGAREALAQTTAWVVLALAFAGGVWTIRGRADALAFVTGYLLEKSLSVDNILMFVLVFRAFAVPPEFQSRVLKLGVVGALAMRCVLILAGAALLHAFRWAAYAFAAVIIWSGVRLLRRRPGPPDLDRSPFLGLARRVLPLASGDTGEALVVRRNGVMMATPLLIVLVLLELADLLFALDSIPAVFAVTGDPLLVYTSNVFAILGLRALYFVIGDLVDTFRHVKTGLAIVLVLAGAKMALNRVYPFPTDLMLGTVVLVLGLSVVASRWPIRQRSA